MESPERHKMVPRDHRSSLEVPIEKEAEKDPKFIHKLALISSIMVFSRLSGVTQYSYFMVDIMEHTQVSKVL